MKASSFISRSSRRIVSLALFAVAFCLIAFILRAENSPKATVAAAPAVDRQNVRDEAPDVAAFRQSVGGSITPLIIELKGEPGVLRKIAAEKEGQPLKMEELFSYAQGLVAEQDAFYASLAGRGVRALLHQKDVTQLDGSIRNIQYRFTYLLNGFISYVATEDIERLKALPEIAHVSEPEPMEFHLDRAIDYSLGTQTNAADRRTAVYGANQEFQPASEPGHFETPHTTKIDGFEGQNMNIAVIDTGLDYRHPMFGGVGQGTPLPRVSGQPTSPEDNRKVIYFYTFNEPAGDPTDDFGHGTHVSGCAAGFSVDGATVPRFGYGTGQNLLLGVGPTPNGVQLFGTAPQAKIMVYKVCGPANNCLGDVPLSIEDAASPFTLVASGTTPPTPVAKPVADVINLSLGSTAGDSASPTSRAANNAVLAGVVLVASAGNSGVPGPTGDATVGAPASATMAIAVGASLDPGSISAGDVLTADQVPTDARVPGSVGPPPETGAASDANTPNPNERNGIRLFPVAGGGPLPGGSLSAHYVYVEDPNTTPPTVRNRIALVRGGAGSFFNIVNAVAVHMPAAIIITDDRESLTALVVAGSIPVFNVNEETTTYLINRISDTDTDADGDGLDDVPVGSISQFPLRLKSSFTLQNFSPGMAGFSSRGPNDHPNAGFRTVKPDVTGPGVGILSAATVEGIPNETIGMASLSGYTQANGTSFSGPITAGAMVLVRQRVREELNLDTTDLADPNYRAKRFETATVARALLQNSATNLRNGFGEPQGDGAGSVASINEMGSGHINVAAALQAKAIMVSPTLLFAASPAEFSPPQASPSPTPMTVQLPTASFGPVPVVELQGTLERTREVIIRDVTGGQGAGTYNLTVQDNRGANNPAFRISFEDANRVSISSVTVPAGGQASFIVRTVADGRQITTAPTEFQWYVTATDASGRTLRMPFYYRAVQADPNVIPVEAAQLQNISTRLNVQTGDNVGIAGFIVTGNEPKRVIVRGIGPSMSVDGQPVNGRLQDPVIEFYDQNAVLIATNDNWKDSPERAEIEQSGLAPQDDRESAILQTVPPGQYTAVIRGKDSSTGIALVEAYDRDQTGDGRFANISTRGFVQTGDNVLIGGFIAGRQPGATNVIVRALGPSLTGRGVAQALQDPTLQLINQNGDVLNSNDDFATSPQRTEIESRGLAPEDPRESALFQTVNPGNYTAIVRGKGDATGVGLVEVYNVQ
jgi:hypothetical protein